MSDGIRIRDLQHADTIKSGDEYKYELLVDSILDLKNTSDTTLQSGKTYYILKKVTDTNIEDDKIYYVLNNRRGPYKPVSGVASGYCRLYNPTEITTSNYFFKEEIVGDGISLVADKIGTDEKCCEKVEAKKMDYGRFLKYPTYSNVDKINNWTQESKFKVKNQITMLTSADKTERLGNNEITFTQNDQPQMSNDVTIDLSSNALTMYVEGPSWFEHSPRPRTKVGVSVLTYKYTEKDATEVSLSGNITDGDCILYGIVKKINLYKEHTWNWSYEIEFEEGTREFVVNNGFVLPWADKIDGTLVLNTRRVYAKEPMKLHDGDIFYSSGEFTRRIYNKNNEIKFEKLKDKNISSFNNIFDSQYYNGIMTAGMLTINENELPTSETELMSVFDLEEGIKYKYTGPLQLPKYDVMGEEITTVVDEAFDQALFYEGFVKANSLGQTFSSTMEYYEVLSGSKTPTKVTSPTEADFNKYYCALDGINYQGFTITPDHSPFGDDTTDLTSIILPEGYKTVGGKAFYGYLSNFQGKSWTDTQIFKIVLPSTLQKIKDKGFCSGRMGYAKVPSRYLPTPIVEVSFPNGKHPDLDLVNVDYDVLVINNESGRDIKLRNTQTGVTGMSGRLCPIYSIYGKIGDKVTNISNKDLYFVSEFDSTNTNNTNSTMGQYWTVNYKNEDGSYNFDQEDLETQINCYINAQKNKNFYDAMNRIYESSDFTETATAIMFKLKGDTSFKSSITSITSLPKENGVVSKVISFPGLATGHAELEAIAFANIVVKVKPGETLEYIDGFWIPEIRSQELINGGTNVSLEGTNLQIQLNNKDYIDISGLANFDTITFIGNDEVEDDGLNFKMIIDLPSKSSAINVVISENCYLKFETPFVYEANTIYRLEISLIQGWFVGKVTSAKIS